MGDGPGEGSSHMRVIVRVRPPNAREMDTNHRLVVQVVDEQMLVLDPKEQAEPSFLQGRQLRQRNMLARKPKDLRFVFDRVFDDTATQQEVFEGSTRSLVEGTLNGFNCTVFAYGATGSGKTHTMLGAPGNPGVMFHTMVSLYRHINDVRDEKRCDVAISYLEVYNEQIRDLLIPSGPLAVHEDPQKGVTVKNLTLHQPQTAEELLQMLERGNLNRTQHPTDANATSSRSHALLQIYVKQQERLAGISQSVRVAKMCLIDLAGSERATVTANRGARFREGANINRSLLALGNCINALADPKNKNQHIPYRNSKLTRLLKDSLGGNCQTIMIAAVSPSSLSLEDTYNTLKYANRAREIKSVLKSNVVSFDCHISRYAKICTELRKEVADLKVKLQAYETGPAPPRTSAVVHGAAPTAERLDRLRSLLGGVLEERRSVRQELLHVDSQLKEMALRSHQRERDQARVCLLCDDHRTVDKATGRLERCTAASRARREHMEERRRAVETRLKDNTERLRVQAAAAVQPSDEPDGALSQLLALGVSGMQHEQEAGGLRECLQHAGRLARLHDTDRQHTERLVTALLRVARKQYDSLASAGLAGAEENADLEEVVRLVRRERAVVWADTAADGDASRDGEGGDAGDAGGGGGDAPCDGSVRSAVEFTLPGLVTLFGAGEAAAAAPAGRDAPPAGEPGARERGLGGVGVVVSRRPDPPPLSTGFLVATVV
uniref:Kinesin-like protein n=1 Tax=Petromyzon marinus TaxID=7757 RepID=A0AAJ7XGI4_PETMA|nr:kinesin-like protein KIF18A [Petromyzon marinus]